MICFGPVSNLWNDSQLPTVPDAVWGRKAYTEEKHIAFLYRPPHSLISEAADTVSHDTPHCLQVGRPGLPGAQSWAFFPRSHKEEKVF